ncbi:MAG: hypothetical protein CK529_11040 [Rhodospirillaceae bacterium]|nr:MAG: hypothetical protein CK529_11040 [Rhodospirillaceae bacterium]
MVISLDKKAFCKNARLDLDSVDILIQQALAASACSQQSHDAQPKLTHTHAEAWDTAVYLSWSSFLLLS